MRIEIGRIADSHSGFVNVLVNLACKSAFQGDAAQPSGADLEKANLVRLPAGMQPSHWQGKAENSREMALFNPISFYYRLDPGQPIRSFAILDGRS